MNAQTTINAADAKPTGLDLLRVPFPPNCISKLPKETKKQIEERRAGNNIEWKCGVCGGMHHKNAVHLDYVGHAALTNRLLDADPSWNWEPMAFAPDGSPAFDANGGLWIKLTVCGQTRLGYGHAEGKRGGDAIKEVIGDALRNAAMRFGAALNLWHKGDLHADEEEQPQSAVQSDDAAVPGGMPDTEFAKLANLLKATGVPAARLLKEYKVENLRLLDQDQYGDAINRLNDKLAKKAREDTNRRQAEPARQQQPAKDKATDFNELLDDEVPF